MNDWLGLHGRRVLVAGGGDFGAAIAEAFLEQGARVAISDVDEDRLRELEDKLRATGHELQTRVCDARDSDACRGLVADVVAALGGLDVLVHAIGRNLRVPITDLSDEQWDDIIAVNLTSAYALGQAAGKVMLAAGHGRITFFSSVSGLLAHADHGPYAASKGGMNQLARVMAAEWASSGVTVNAVAPGYAETNLTRDYLQRDGNREKLSKLVPAGRLAEANDIVGPTLFLSSDRAAFVTGHVMYVDGGRTLN